MNIAALERVKQDFIENPHQVDMGLWVCGTMCCIGGKLALNAGWNCSPFSGMYKGTVRRPDVSSWSEAATLELGVDHIPWLFDILRWPEGLGMAYATTGSVKYVIEAIDLFIEQNR